MREKTLLTGVKAAVARSVPDRYIPGMGFLSTWLSELHVQRMNLRKRLNESRASLIEFGLLACLMLGSVGLLVPERGFEAAPWGVAIPFLYAAAMIVVELIRQNALARGGEAQKMRRGYGRVTGLIGLVAAAAGMATFIHAIIHGQPIPPPEPVVPEDLQRALEATISK